MMKEAGSQVLKIGVEFIVYRHANFVLVVSWFRKSDNAVVDRKEFGDLFFGILQVKHIKIILLIGVHSAGAS
jgi:hypothetical protein